MAPNLRRFRNHVREKVSFFSERLIGWCATFTRKDRDFKSQRMCPFCGLITSRYKTCCLECGKSLNPA
jgi:hypothetical protein